MRDTQPVHAELAQRGAILVEERVLRRVIKNHRKIRRVGLQVPHELCYTLSRTDLEGLVQRDEVAVDLRTLPSSVIVIAGDRIRPLPGASKPQSQLWRAMFHARIHQHFEALLAQRELTAASIRERVNQIGQTEFDEIRSVLQQEDLLLPPIDPVATYVEFVALYLELKHFAPLAVDRTFPAVLDIGVVDAAIERDVDAESILAASRPPHAPDLPPLAPPVEPDPIPQPARPGSIDPWAGKVAATARSRGNLVRAALYATRAGDHLSARGDIEDLIGRLGQALGGVSTDGWIDALVPLVRVAATRRSVRRDPGTALLLDLQTACAIAEREDWIVDAVTWALSRGKRPIVRPLPANREVRVAKRVRAAEARVALCALGLREERDRLAAAVHDMTHRADDRLRSVLRPKVEAALEEVGLRPTGLTERVAVKKLVDELLDRAVAVGRLSLQDLRDAISRNDLKMSDLSLYQLRTGDPLLRADQILASSLDGVYRRGESYLRFQQKLSSVLFGTSFGRLLTLYLLLPLLSSFALMEGLQHTIGPAVRYFSGHEPVISTQMSILAGAALVFLLLHVAPFRRTLTLAARGFGRVLRWALIDLPLAFWFHPVVQRVLASKVVRWAVKPSIPAAVPIMLGSGGLRWLVAILVFVAAGFAMNSRWGRIAEEVVADWAARLGRQLTGRIIPGLVRSTLELFSKLLELTERGIYRVDEWLRLRKGRSGVMLVIQGVVGTLWFFVAYFLRLYINLFVEPTINPIKHFPVVTVAAKIILPFIPAMLTAIAAPVTKVLGSAFGNSFAAVTVLVLPGLAGFVVWELKENWRLYRATRPRVLQPLAIGDHGETMASFLRPGLFSGTVPKIFTRLRRAAWRGDERGIAHEKEALHHAEKAIARFVDRQLVSLLNEVPPFGATDVARREVDIGSNRIRIALACPSISPELATIRFEQQSGWFVASVPQSGWIDRLSSYQRAIFELALAGFFKLSGVDLSREQLEEVLRGSGATVPRYDIADHGLVVWPGDSAETEVVYDLAKANPRPRIRGARREGEVVDLRARHAIFGREPIHWAVWSTTWFEILRGDEPRHIGLGPSLVRE